MTTPNSKIVQMGAEKLSVGTILVASRWKAALLALGSIGFVLIGFLVIHLHGLRIQIAGWLSIVFFGGCSLVWLGAIAIPTRLMITADGFSVKQLLLPERRYAWDKIDKLWAIQRPIIPIVVWTYKERSKLLSGAKAAAGRRSIYDDGLSPVWRVSAVELAAGLNASRGDNSPARG